MSFDTVTLAGKKRKRRNVEVDAVSKLTGKLHHHQKEVRKIAKKAKSFEIQRLVKRIKGLQEPSERQKNKINKSDFRDLEQQLEFLKNIDLEYIAYHALISKIHKDKILNNNESMISAIQSLPSVSSTILSPTETHQKVEARLISSKLLAAGVNSVIEHLRGAVDSKLRSKTRDKLGSSVRHEDAGDTNEDGSTVDENAMSIDMELRAMGTISEEVHDSVDDEGWESGSIHDSESGEDDGDEESEGQNEADMKDSGAERDGPDPQAKRSKTYNNQEKEAAGAANSTFLPSLSVGFIRGDSGSDPEFDSEGENVKSGRKNRRGQRARQAIWAKKYGKNAKHVRERQEKMQATTMGKRLGKRQDKGWSGKGDFSPDISNKRNEGVQTSDRPTPIVNKPIHPSWEARKKLKEKEGRLLPPQGKRIIFK